MQPASVHVRCPQRQHSQWGAGGPHLHPAVQALLRVPVVLEAGDGQQVHHKLLGADAQGLPGEPPVRQAWKQLPDTHLLPALQSGMQNRGFPWSAGAPGIRGHCHAKLPLGQGLVQMTLPCLPVHALLATLVPLTCSP